MPTLIPAIGKTIFSVLLFITLKATAQPTISSITPASGAVGSSVTITGTNFNAVPTDNIVYFGAVRATVTSGTTISLNVTVPAGTTYQPISVLDIVTGLTDYYFKPFVITFTNPFGTGIPSNFYQAKVDFVTGTNPRFVAIGDVDGDGKSDMVVANSNSNNVSVLRNTSSGGSISASSFAAKVDFATASFPRSVAIGDVDGDGKPDLVVVNEATSSISVLRNTSTSGIIDPSSFATKVDFSTDFSTPVSVAIGDVDGDGKPELVAVNSTNNDVSVFQNTSTAGIINASSFAAKVDFTTGTTPFFVAVSDVDDNTQPELVVANAAVSANSISVLHNTATAGLINSFTFAPKVDFTTGPIPRSVAIGDVDGDGKPDFVVANSATSPASTTISVLRNTSTPGSITAEPKVDFTAGTVPSSVAISDVDGDGKLDLVVANENSNTISVLRNTSTSGIIDVNSFAPKVDFATALGPVSIAIGDLDGDGIPEVAAANNNSASVSVFQLNFAAALPVKLTEVKAYQKNSGVQVEWTAQQESNIDRYEVERSQNGQQFFKLGSVPAKGNSTVAIKYNLFDTNPLSGVSFYRIKIIEDAGVTYSKVLRINISNSPVNKVTIYPNPINGNTIALQVNLQKGNYLISITNKLGQQIVSKVLVHAGGSATEIIEPAKALAKGVYHLRISGGGINIISQVIKN